MAPFSYARRAILWYHLMAPFYGVCTRLNSFQGSHLPLALSSSLSRRYWALRHISSMTTFNGIPAQVCRWVVVVAKQGIWSPPLSRHCLVAGRLVATLISCRNSRHLTWLICSNPANCPMNSLTCMELNWTVVIVRGGRGHSSCGYFWSN